MMCCGKKEYEKGDIAPLPDAPKEEAPSPAPIVEPPKQGTASVKDALSLSKMSDSKLLQGQQSIDLTSTHGKKGNMVQGVKHFFLFLINSYI